MTISERYDRHRVQRPAPRARVVLAALDRRKPSGLPLIAGVFDAGQLVIVPLSDRYGRRPVLLCNPLFCDWACPRIIWLVAQAFDANASEPFARNLRYLSMGRDHSLFIC